MQPSESRFSVALNLAFAAMAVLISGQVEQANAAQPKHDITALEDEFADVYASGKQINARLCRAAITDIENKPWHSGQIAIRLMLLRRATVMPSAAVRAIAAAAGASRDCPRSSLQRSYYRGVAARVAREIGADERFVRLSWNVEFDLDEQWHALRRELLAIRAERAKIAGAE